jgi:hypothetical protein
MRVTLTILVALGLIPWASGCDPRPVRTRDAGARLDAALPFGDLDLDGIADDHEGRALSTDTDADGIIDAADLDSDSDGIPDASEAGDADPTTLPRDTDGDGTPDFRDLDSDGNGIPDAVESTGDLDSDGIPDAIDLDDDGDHVTDARELDGRPPVDTDGDGVFDHLDQDSDDDTILDGHEHGLDTDRDGDDDARDLDSDGDGFADAIEAGDAELATLPIDTDGDGRADFRDADSDGDGVADASELEEGTDRVATDTDGDGVDDLIEVSYGSRPTDATDSPRTHGDFVFVVPYSSPDEGPISPSPARDSLSFSTSLRRVDVYVTIDSSGSMGGEIHNLTEGFVSTVVPEIRARIPEAQFGVGRFEDCTTSACPDSIHNLQDITVDGAAVETALRSIETLCGGSEPYRQVLWLLATGDTSGFSGAVLPRARRCADPSSIGWPCFRPDAVRVVVQVGDEVMGEDRCTPARSHTDAVAAMLDAGIRYIGIEAGNPTLREEMRSVGRDTGSVSATTGEPFVYSVSTDGAGLSTTVVDAVEELAGNIPLRVDALASDDPDDGVNAVAAFVQRIETNTSGATVLGRVCTDLPNADGDRDGEPDHFPSVLPGTSVCFDIVARPNRTVPPTGVPQIFHATLDVVGDRSTPLDERDIYFVVPPTIMEPGGPH